MHSWKNSIADMIVIDDWFIKELKLLNKWNKKNY